MLVALTEHRKLFIIDSKTPHSTFKKIREQTKFYCPQCGEILQFKIGSVKIPHFAHLKDSSCNTYFSEGESEQHLLGKEDLYQLFSYLKLTVQLEPYLPDLKQRPDLLITKERRYAIEFQCSTLQYDSFLQRNQGYLHNNIVPIWIVKTPVQIKKVTGIQKLSISAQYQQFFNCANGQKYLITYDPINKQFIYLSNFIHLNGNTFLTKIIPLPLYKQKFPFYLPQSLMKDEFSYAIKKYYSYKIQYLKRRVLLSRKGVNDLFLRSVYELRLDYKQMPIIVGVPIRGGELFKVCAVEWQTALFYFIHFHEIKVHAINKGVIYDFLNWAKMKKTSEAINVVERYCSILQNLSVETVYSTVSHKQLEHLLYKQFLATERKY